MRKGSQIALVGRLQNRIWKDKEEKEHRVTEIIAEEVYFAESKVKGESSENSFIVNEVPEDPIESDDDLPF